MWFDKKDFSKKTREILDDIDKGECNSKGWMWIIGGALLGLTASCLKISKTKKPILAHYNRIDKE